MKHYNKLLLFSFLLLILVSCKKVINTTETDLIAGENALQTVGYNEQAILGAYAATGIEMAILLNATFADEVKVAEFYNAGTTHEWQYASTDVGLRDNFTATTPNYRVIDRVNRVLEALPTADSTKAGDNALRLKLRGEALFLRAFSHFELYRFYCSNYNPDGLAMPYMETRTENPADPQARIKQSDYFAKMSADVADAKLLLPNNLTDINRATRLAATALQARIALYKKDWAAAETFSTEFITGLPLASMANFPGIWTDANTSEVAFRLVRTSSFGGRIGSLWRATSANAANIGTVTWRPSDEIWGAYDQVNDVRFASYFKNEPLLAPARGTRLIYKYAGTAYATANENVANAKVYRTGEMYLIRAEARAEQNKITGANSAESDINDLRAARITGYVNVVFASKAEAIDAVLLERYKELAYEGHRFWDLKRRGLPVERLATDAPTTNAAVLPAGNFRFLLPIPDPEMKANTLMVQNPGYN